VTAQAAAADHRAQTALPPHSATAAGRALRICMVHYSDFHIDSRIQRQARALAERGDEVDLVCLSAPGERRVGAGLIRIHRVGGGKAQGGAASYVWGYLRFFARALARVAALDSERRFDVVEAHNMPDFLAFTALRPKLRGTPVILNVHDTFPELFATMFRRRPDGLAVRLVTAQERLSAAFADAVVAVTPEAAERLASRGAGGRRSLVVMNAPDERVFGPPRPPATIPAGGAIQAIYHGGLAPRFGVELLVDAVGRLYDTLPRLSLRVCGTGPNRDRLAALAEERAPGRIHVAAAAVPFEQIPAELERAHLGVVPTRPDRFTELLLPVKLLEYVHMGLPAVAPRLPVIERYFGGGEVTLFEPGSAAALAEAIAGVCADPAAARERALRASARLAAVGWPQQRQGYLGLVDELVAGRRRRAEITQSQMKVERQGRR